MAHRTRPPTGWIQEVKLLAVIMLAGFSATSTTAALAQTPGNVAGIWYDSAGEGAIELAPCGNRMCGQIIWLKQPLNAQGNPLHDRNNPNATMQSRPICGLQILRDLQPLTDGSWGRGIVYDPKKGAENEASVKLLAPKKLQLTGYGLFGLSKSFEWARAPDDIQRCNGAPGQAAAASPAGGAAPAATKAAPTATKDAAAIKAPVAAKAKPAPVQAGTAPLTTPAKPSSAQPAAKPSEAQKAPPKPSSAAPQLPSTKAATASPAAKAAAPAANSGAAASKPVAAKATSTGTSATQKATQKATAAPAVKVISKAQPATEKTGSAPAVTKAAVVPAKKATTVPASAEAKSAGSETKKKVVAAPKPYINPDTGAVSTAAPVAAPAPAAVTPFAPQAGFANQ